METEAIAGCQLQARQLLLLMESEPGWLWVGGQGEGEGETKVKPKRNWRQPEVGQRKPDPHGKRQSTRANAAVCGER